MECPGECGEVCDFCFTVDDCMEHEECEWTIEYWEGFTEELYEYSYCYEPYDGGDEEFWDADNCNDCLYLGGTW